MNELKLLINDLITGTKINLYILLSNSSKNKEKINKYNEKIINLTNQLSKF